MKLGPGAWQFVSTAPELISVPSKGGDGGETAAFQHVDIHSLPLLWFFCIPSHLIPTYSSTPLIMSFTVPPIPSLISTKEHSQLPSNSIRSPRSPASPYDPLSAALSTAGSRYTLANARSLAAHNEACHDLPGGNTRTTLHSSPFPITFGEQDLTPQAICNDLLTLLCSSPWGRM